MGLIAAEIGLMGSFALTLYVGRNNASQLLKLIFLMWVSVPFVILLIAHVQSKKWSERSRGVLDWLSYFVTAITLAVYGLIALYPPRTKRGFAFVVLPPLSVLVSAVVGGIAALRLRKPE
jgi:hypothetical protein